MLKKIQAVAETFGNQMETKSSAIAADLKLLNLMKLTYEQLDVGSIRKDAKSQAFLESIKDNKMAVRIMGLRMADIIDREYKCEIAGITYRLNLPPWHCRLMANED